jgi:hypothetical protein
VIIIVEECSDMSTYIQTHWVTHLRVSCLLNMSLVLDQRERKISKVAGKSRNDSSIPRMVLEGFKTLPMVYRKVS